MRQLRLIPRREPADIVAQALAAHKPSSVFVLFSGGKDSSVVLDYMWRYHREIITGAVHINTGIGIPSTRDFAESFCRSRAIPFLEYKTPMDYEQIVVKHGFPGPATHREMYISLKERALDAVMRDHKKHLRDRIMLVTGVRAAESLRRMGTTRDIVRKKTRVWVAPLIDFDDDDMWGYRRKFDVQMSEASALIHLSGECLCGAYARPDEMLDIETFYPEVAARIHRIEQRVREAGHRRCIWGKSLPGDLESKMSPGPLCIGCTLFDADQVNGAA